MPKRSKFIMYILILGLLGAIAAVVFTSREKNTTWPAEEPEVNYKELVKDYQAEAKDILGGLKNSEALEKLSAADTAELREKLLNPSITVPAEFRDFHLDLVLALNEIEDSINSGNAELLNQGLEKFKNSIKSCSWLE